MPASAEARSASGSIAAKLIDWFSASARDLPWRTNRTGYRVWVSEVMLQQTRVSTVIPYYGRFLEAFPTLGDLARAELGQVLALWSGLGYYRRARGLHEGARQVLTQFGGELPTTAEGLRQIKGIGAYTAGAIASLAFGERTPMVDGNVIRVICRLFAIEEDTKKTATQKRIWQQAGALLPERNAGAFNEALMELGATVCLPRDPLCLVCPVMTDCQARARGIEKRLPMAAPQKAVPIVRVAAFVARREGKVLLGRRRADALFGGLWEPPMVELPEGISPEEGVRPFVEQAKAGADVEHVLTHRRMIVTVLEGKLADGAVYPPVYEEIQEVAESELACYGVSTLAKKVMMAASSLAPEAKAPRAKKTRRPT